MTCQQRYSFSLSWSTVMIWFKLSCFCVLLRGQTCNPSRKAIVIMLKLKTPSRQMIKQFSNGYWNTSKIPDFCETHVLISKLRISRKTLVSFSILTLNLVLRSVSLILDLHEFPISFLFLTLKKCLWMVSIWSQILVNLLSQRSERCQSARKR